jgi:prepilin-type N-terminal cleavage/methylation domain-containing protein
LKLAADFGVPSRPPVKFPTILKNAFRLGGCGWLDKLFFTLIELLAVIAIIAILAAVLLPDFEQSQTEVSSVVVHEPV